MIRNPRDIELPVDTPEEEPEQLEPEPDEDDQAELAARIRAAMKREGGEA